MNHDVKLSINSGKYCLIDLDGNIVVEPKEDYDMLYFPSNGLCQVEKDGLCGYINMSGEVAIPLQYKGAYAFSESGLAFVVGEDGLGGYIDQYGQFVIEPIYDTGSIFRFGMAAVSRNGKYIYIYENGNKAINNTFKWASGFADSGVAKTQLLDGRQGLMDNKSKILLTLKHGCELEEFKGGSKVTTFRVNGKKALVTTSGDIITGLKYDEVIISPNSGLHPFLRNGLWGYMNDKGVEVIPNIYLTVTPFTEYNIASVTAFHPLAENNQWQFYINETDAIIDSRLVEAFHQSFQPKFSNVYPFNDGLALAVKKDAACDRSEYHYGETSDPYEYDDYEDETEWSITSLYVIEIDFRYMKKEGIIEFINDKFGDVQIITIKDHYSQFVYSLDASIEKEEIEIIMYYALDDTRIGDYDYYQLI